MLGGVGSHKKRYHHCSQTCSVLCVLEHPRVDSSSAGPLKHEAQLALVRLWIQETVRMYEQRQDLQRSCNQIVIYILRLRYATTAMQAQSKQSNRDKYTGIQNRITMQSKEEDHLDVEE